MPRKTIPIQPFFKMIVFVLEDFQRFTCIKLQLNDFWWIPMRPVMKECSFAFNVSRTNLEEKNLPF